MAKMFKNFKDLGNQILRDYGKHETLLKSMGDAVMKEVKAQNPNMNMEASMKTDRLEIRALTEPDLNETVRANDLANMYGADEDKIMALIRSEKLPAKIENGEVVILKVDLFKLFPEYQNLDTRRQEFMGPGAFYRTTGKFKTKQHMTGALKEQGIKGIK